MGPELCLAWVCVHPLVWLLNRLKEEEALFAWQLMVLAEPGGLPQPQWDVLFPWKRELPWCGQCFGFMAEHSWGLCTGP